MKMSIAVAVFVLIGQLNTGWTDTGSNACLNGGSFSVTAHGFSCNCKKDFAGTRCENDCGCKVPKYQDTVCTVGLQSFGYYGTDGVMDGFISVNHQKLITTKESSDQGTRGINIVALDSTNCAKINSVRWDTKYWAPSLATPASITQAIQKWFDAFAKGTVFVIATSEDAQQNGYIFYPFIKSLGGPQLSDKNFDWGGRYAIVAQKGYPAKTIALVGMAKSPKINLNVAVTGTTADNLKFTQIP